MLIPPEKSNALRPFETGDLADPRAANLAARAAIYALERRYLDRIDWQHARLHSTQPPLDWQLDARFIRVERVGTPGGDDPRGLLRLGMQSLFGAMHQPGGAVVFALGSDGHTHTLNLGIRAHPTANLSIGALTGALAGNLPGSRWSPLAPGHAEHSLVEPLRTWK